MTVSDEELDELLARIKARHDQLKDGSCRMESFLLHVRALGSWEQEPMDYPDIEPVFPETLPVAWAVCHPDCGCREFIVEGSTQECQHCGRLMFRLSMREYRKIV